MGRLQETARQIAYLEKQCQDGVDIELNMKKMEDLVSSLNIDEIITLAALMENINLQN